MNAKITMRNTKQDIYNALSAEISNNAELMREIHELEQTIKELKSKAQSTNGRKAAYKNRAKLRAKHAPAACKHYKQKSVTLSELDTYIDEIALVD